MVPRPGAHLIRFHGVFAPNSNYRTLVTPANLGDAGHRWMVAIGPIDGNKAVLDIDSPYDGLFDNPRPIEHKPDGTITLTFEDCNTGTVEYDILSINQQGTVPIQRVAHDNIALCETLSTP